MRPGASLAILLTASTGCAMTVLDTNVVAVVLPTIARDLGALMSPVSPTIANEIAHRGYAVGFVAAPLAAAVVAGLSAIVVAIQMRSARSRSSSQTAFAVNEEDRSARKLIVSAASVRAAPLVFDAKRTPDAAAGCPEREKSCSA